jgi:hypothetical protein
VFLVREENGFPVYVYEPLRDYELHNRLCSGWELIE